MKEQTFLRKSKPEKEQPQREICLVHDLPEWRMLHCRLSSCLLKESFMMHTFAAANSPDRDEVKAGLSTDEDAICWEGNQRILNKYRILLTSLVYQGCVENGG